MPPGELLPQALALAADIAGALPEVVQIYKRLIDDGYAGTLADGLAAEQAASRRWTGTLDAEALRARREDVQARGRSQSS